MSRFPARVVVTGLGLPGAGTTSFVSLNGFVTPVFDAFALDPDAGLGGSCPDWEPDGERDENDAGGVSGSYGIALPTLSVSFSASGVRSCV